MKDDDKRESEKGWKLVSDTRVVRRLLAGGKTVKGRDFKPARDMYQK
jgi:hypothetical protein